MRLAEFGHIGFTISRQCLDTETFAKQTAELAGAGLALDSELKKQLGELTVSP